MAKKKFDLKNNQWVVYVIVGILFFYGGQQGWFKSTIDIGLPSNINPFHFTLPASEIVTDPVPGLICTFSFDKSQACVGDPVRGTIHDGGLRRCVVAYSYEYGDWNIYNVINLDINGDYSETQSAETAGNYRFAGLCGYFQGETFFPECRTNDAKIEIIVCDDEEEPEPPPDEGLQPGDVVGSGGGDYTIGVDGEAHFEIQLVPTDEQFDMCAEIERRSSKVDLNCNPTGDLEDWNEFVFLDSYSVVWSRSDQIFAGVSVGPNTFGNPDVVNVRWDGVNPFKGHLYHIGPCAMHMEMKVTLVVCE